MNFFGRSQYSSKINLLKKLFCIKCNETRNIYNFLRQRYTEDRRVVVTGLGVVSPIGNDVSTAWKNIINGECAIEKLTDDLHKELPCRVGASIDKRTLRGYDTLEKHELLNNSSKFVMIAAAEAITDAGLDFDDPRERQICGVSCGCSYINASEFISSYKQFEKGGFNDISKFSLMRLLLHVPGSMLCYKYQTSGPIMTPNAGGATGLVAIGEGFRVVRNNPGIDIMMCGGTESGVTAYTMASMSRVGMLTTKYNDNPKGACRPFDKDRDGDVIGEGAAILILEELNHALDRKARIYCELRGFAATSGVAPKKKTDIDNKGLLASMNNAMIDAHFLPDYVSYINANASSSIESDYTEAMAIQKLFGDRSWELFVSSTKGAHGNLLSATGSVETVFTCMAIYDGIVPPTLNINMDDSEFILNFIPETNKTFYSERRITLKNSRSITGVNASLCLCQYIH